MAWNTTINTSLLSTYLLRKFIPALEDELQYQKFTMKASIPPGEGKIARWNLFSSPPAQSSSLTEGTTTGNEITTITTTGTESTIVEEGEFIPVTSLQEFAQVRGSREELANRMSYGAARTLDLRVRTQALTTSVDFYATGAAIGGSATADTPLACSASAIIGSAKLLRDVSARGFTGVSGHPGGHLAAILTPQAELGMVTEATTARMTWAEANTDVGGAMAQDKWVNGFMGSVYGTACYRTQAFSNTVVTVTANNNFVLAHGGLGSVSIKDADPNIFINTASAGDIGNPYRNRNTIAWHAFFVADMLDVNRVVRLYTAAQ